jgi:glycosyltransferase involved in cell wall biosynthesis
MRIGIFDPYLDTLGGGERYILSAAACLARIHDVEIFWDDEIVLHEASQKLNIDLSKVDVVPNIFSKKVSFSKRLIQTNKYDRILFLSDGSIPWLFAKKNLILFQFPVNWVKGKSISSKLKLKNVYKVICYTDFVKKHLDRTFDINSQIIYPPVETFGKSEKQDIILSVGRFTKAMNAKKQEVLIDCFKKMCDEGLKDWKLLVVGSYLYQDEDLVHKIEDSVKSYPIEIITNASFNELKSYYQKARIYWHAAGYGENLEKHPERAEHFGITTVEAMGAGAVPVVIDAGGQKEIVENGENGYLWNTLSELSDITKKLIQNPKLLSAMSEKSLLRAKDFSKEKFCKKIIDLIEE